MGFFRRIVSPRPVKAGPISQENDVAPIRKQVHKADGLTSSSHDQDGGTDPPLHISSYIVYREYCISEVIMMVRRGGTKGGGAISSWLQP
eukprot:13207375-Ditylum_brightwellii.AAC.1